MGIDKTSRPSQKRITAKGTIRRGLLGLKKYKLKEKEILSSGSYGTASIAKKRGLSGLFSDKSYVVKVDKADENGQVRKGGFGSVAYEVSILQALSEHPCRVKFKGASDDKNTMLTNKSGKTVHSHLDAINAIEDPAVKQGIVFSIIRDSLEETQDLDRQGYAQNDAHTGNLLLDKRAVRIDYGLATKRENNNNFCFFDYKSFAQQYPGKDTERHHPVHQALRLMQKTGCMHTPTGQNIANQLNAIIRSEARGGGRFNDAKAFTLGQDGHYTEARQRLSNLLNDLNQNGTYKKDVSLVSILENAKKRTAQISHHHPNGVVTAPQLRIPLQNIKQPQLPQNPNPVLNPPPLHPSNNRIFNAPPHPEQVAKIQHLDLAVPNYQNKQLQNDRLRSVDANLYPSAVAGALPPAHLEPTQSQSASFYPNSIAKALRQPTQSNRVSSQGNATSFYPSYMQGQLLPHVQSSSALNELEQARKKEAKSNQEQITSQFEKLLKKMAAPEMVPSLHNFEASYHSQVSGFRATPITVRAY